MRCLPEDSLRGTVPSQKQVHWAQLRVGLTVLFAAITLGVLIFLMTGTTGLFTKKITLICYVDNAGGLRSGAPVRLQGVDVGNVSSIRVVPGHAATPVEVRMKVGMRDEVASFIKKDTKVQMSTAGVLGETFVDLDSTKSTGAQAKDGDVLPALDVPDLQDVVRASSRRPSTRGARRGSGGRRRGRRSCRSAGRR